MTPKRHPPELRAQVVAALLTGESVPDVSRRFGVALQTIRNWQRTIDPAKLQQIAEKRETDYDELLFAYLRTNVESLTIQVRHFGDKAWLSKQSAHDVAILHGVQIDKAIRLFELIERTAAADPRR